MDSETDRRNDQSHTQGGDPTLVSRSVREIREITQIGGSFQRVPAVDHRQGLVAVMPEASFRYERIDEDTIVVSADLKFEGRALLEKVAAPAEDLVDQSPRVVAVNAVFVVVYELDPGVSLSDADLQVFAEVNGCLNVWPYWRAYLQESLARAGLPVFTAPPYNLARALGAKGECSDDTRD